MSDVFATEIVVDPDVPLVRIARVFAAPRAKVFLAHTDPELVVQWNGPHGTVMRIDHWDCRAGGSYRFLSRTRLTATSLVDSFADRDAFVASGMEHGVREGYQRLDTVLGGIE